MNCPYCGSTLLEEASNFNEFTCKLCRCEFKHDDDKYRIFEEGNYKKFCDNVMYHLCEKASPKVSNILVSVLSQLKNNGVEEIDTVLEHLQMVSSNVSSEIVIGLQTESDLEVVKEGIDHFISLGNTLIKRDDLELDLHRFTRLQEAKVFYEKVYGVSSLPTVTVKPLGSSDTKEVVAGAVDENAMDGLSQPPVDIGEDPASTIMPPAGLPPEGIPVEDELEAQKPIGGISDTEIGGPNDPDLQVGGDPTAIAPADIAQHQSLATPSTNTIQPTPDLPFEENTLNKLAEIMAKGYNEGTIAMEADFAEALMGSEEAKGLCENLGSMPEEKVFELAQKVAGMLTPPNETEGNEEVTPEQLQEALEILSSAVKLNEEELKDL